jgi:hypothetical protein
MIACRNLSTLKVHPLPPQRELGGCFSELSAEGLALPFDEFGNAECANNNNHSYPVIDTHRIVLDAARPHCPLLSDELFELWLEECGKQQSLNHILL